MRWLETGDEESGTAPRKSAFVVGRSAGRSTLLLFVSVMRGPIAGPWTLRAVVSSN